jgi:Rad3-related DNA helicase
MSTVVLRDPAAQPAEIPLEEERIEVPDVLPAFAPDGPIARALGERYRYRPGQVEMAQAVRRALNEGRPALVEAGTGSGKSFAYLVPLIAGGVRAVVSTANKTLQTQLWEKDIPALQQVLSRPFTAALLKGRANYVCALKLRELPPQMSLFGQPDGPAELLARLRAVPSGDVEELGLFGEARDALTAGQDDCLGRECPLLAECAYERARLRAEQADLVVVNHALLAMSLTRSILSPRPVIVVDEAHELPRYVIGALRIALEYTTVVRLVNDAVVQRNVPDRLRQETVQINHLLFESLARSMRGGEHRWAVQGALEEGVRLTGQMDGIVRRLLRSSPGSVGGDGDVEAARHQATLEWARRLSEQVRALSEEPPDDQVRYCEEQPGRSELERILLCREPLDVAEFLSRTLFEPTPRVICTGATLTVAGQFNYFRRETGAPHRRAIERQIESPFDYAHQALLYTPDGLEPVYGPGEEEYVRKLGREVWRLVQASRGRAFVLCTSARRMRQLYDLLQPHLEYTCYCQGDGLPRAELLDRFQNDARGAVLFATRSFWEGVDIPGEALSLVIVDKLPFAPYRDPVVEGRQQRIRESGGDPFNEMSLPEAILLLRQGLGRLIRTETDRGVMAILDSRVNTRRYGQQVIASLPPARRTKRIADVRRFFAAERGSGER